jgi:hypothetical protein
MISKVGLSCVVAMLSSFVSCIICLIVTGEKSILVVASVMNLCLMFAGIIGIIVVSDKE